MSIELTKLGCVVLLNYSDCCCICWSGGLLCLLCKEEQLDPLKDKETVFWI